MDLTRNKHAGLVDHEALLSGIVEDTGTLVLVLDETGRIVGFNQACEHATGYRAGDISGERLWDVLLTEPEAGHLRAVFQNLAAARFPEQRESYWVTRDGGFRRIVWNQSLMHDARDGRRYVPVIGLDITDRGQNENELLKLTRTLEQRVLARTRELQESQRMLDSLVCNLPGMVYRCRHDALWSMEYVSDGVLSLTGHTPEDYVSGRINFANVIHPEDRPCVAEAVDEQIRSGQPFQLEYRIITAGGEEKWVWERGNAVYSEDGALLALEGFVTDISQRKAAEEKIRLSEARLAEAQRIARLGNWDWDIVSNTLAWSDEIYRIFGLQPREFGATYEEFLNSVHPDDRAHVQRAVDEALERGTPYSIDHRILLPDGGQRIVHEQAEVTFDGSGRALRMMGTVQDITERKQMELALAESNEALEKRVEERTARLRESEERFRQLAENINEVFWMTTPDGGEVLYISPAYEQTWGRGRDQVYDNPRAWLEAVHPGDRSRVENAFFNEIATGRFDEEFRIVRPDGSVRWVRDRAFAVRNEAGEIYRVAGIAEDVTAQKEASEALNQSREQLRQLALHQEADRESLRTRIAREIHDELGQALMALNLDLHWLLRRYESGEPLARDQVDKKLREMMEMVSQTARAVQKISSELRPIILDDLGLEAALVWYVEQFQQKTGMQAEKAISLGEDRFADELATTLYRVLQEALTNISRHARATRFSVEVTQQGEHIRMLISDNGVGIDEDRLRKNDSFGLIGMRERVLALQGHLDIRSEPGRGTVVSITLPTAPHVE